MLLPPVAGHATTVNTLQSVLIEHTVHTQVPQAQNLQVNPNFQKTMFRQRK